MKLLGPLALLLVGGLLAWIAWRAPAQDTTPAPPPAEPVAVPHRLSGEAGEGLVVRTFAVEGMCCNGCEEKLFLALTAVDGVEEAAVDHILGRAQAVVPEEMDPGALAAALTVDKYAARLEP